MSGTCWAAGVEVSDEVGSVACVTLPEMQMSGYVSVDPGGQNEME